MLPIVLVLLVATSALATPIVNLNLVDINDVAPPKGTGKLISSAWSERASEIVDGGEMNVYVLTVKEIFNDLANLNDSKSQALALAQIIGWLGPQSTGIPGDACAAANLIDAYVYAARSKNYSNLRPALISFIQRMSDNIDRIAKLAVDPDSMRYAVGPRGNCNGGGRSYRFEAAWDYILSNATPSSAGLINEQYCAAKRLYSSFYSSNNNVGAILTASSLPPVNSVFLTALDPVARFVAAISSGNPAASAGAAKQALARAAASIPL